MAALVIFGLFGYSNLPVSELPAVDFPTHYSLRQLAVAQTTETVASRGGDAAHKNQFSTILRRPPPPDARQAAQDDHLTITIQFDLDRNIDGAAEDVQAAIQQASRQLPVVIPSPPTLRKVSPADAPILFVAAQSDSMPHLISSISWRKTDWRGRFPP